MLLLVGLNTAGHKKDKYDTSRAADDIWWVFGSPWIFSRKLSGELSLSTSHLRVPAPSLSDRKGINASEPPHRPEDLNVFGNSSSTKEDLYWLQYISRVKEPQHVRAVCVFPSTRGDHQSEIQKMIARKSTILVQRYVYLNSSDAADMFIQQIFPDKEWVVHGKSKDETNKYFPKVNNKFPVWVVFIRSSNLTNSIDSIGKDIKNKFHFGDHDIYITKTNTQAKSVAQLVLNKNSVAMLHKLPLKTQAQRKQQSPCVPTTSEDPMEVYYLDGKLCLYGEVNGKTGKPIIENHTKDDQSKNHQNGMAGKKISTDTDVEENPDKHVNMEDKHVNMDADDSDDGIWWAFGAPFDFGRKSKTQTDSKK